MTDPDARSIAEEYVSTDKAGREQLRIQYASDYDFWTEVQRHVADLIVRPVDSARSSTNF